MDILVNITQALVTTAVVLFILHRTGLINWSKLA